MTTSRSTIEHTANRDQTLLAMFTRHAEVEGAALASYRELADNSSAGEAIKYLVDMVLDDEERHHRLFEEMGNQIRSFLWDVPVEPHTPAMTHGHDPELLAATGKLLAMEREDLDELHALRKALRHSPSSSIQPALVETMIHDTQKHIVILETIAKSLTR